MRKVERRMSERKESALPIERESRDHEEDDANKGERCAEVNERPVAHPEKEPTDGESKKGHEQAAEYSC